MGLIIEPPFRRPYEEFSCNSLHSRSKACQTDEVPLADIDALVKELEMRSSYLVQDDEDDNSLAMLMPSGRPSMMTLDDSFLQTRPSTLDALIRDRNQGALVDFVQQTIIVGEGSQQTKLKPGRSVPALPSRSQSQGDELELSTYRKRSLKDPKSIGTYPIGADEWISNARLPVHEYILSLITSFCEWRLRYMNPRTFAKACLEKGWPKAGKWYEKYLQAGSGPNLLMEIEKAHNVTIAISDWMDGLESSVVFQFQGKTCADVEKSFKALLSTLSSDIITRSSLPKNMQAHVEVNEELV